MANVAFSPQPNINCFGFHSRPPKAASTGFGFGLSMTNPVPASHAWSPIHVGASQQQMQLSSSNTRMGKRRHEDDNESDGMERTPTPERPMKRIVSKRARTVVSEATEKGMLTSGAGKEQRKADGDDIDVGVLLASLPQEALLPILATLLQVQPQLKNAILPLIPRPTVDSAIQTIVQAARKLRDAYPYSNNNSESFNTFGLGFGFGSTSNITHTHHHSSAMRDPYVATRIAPHVTQFVSAWQSYIPYFTSIESSSTSEQQRVSNHPAETYAFLAATTEQFFNQMPLTQASLAPQLLPRLGAEWRAWVHQVDAKVNQRGGMFGQEAVRSWIAGLDEFAVRQDGSGEGARVMSEVRDKWVHTVGWLVGRRNEHPMD